jgi:hypothetical protein
MKDLCGGVAAQTRASRLGLGENEFLEEVLKVVSRTSYQTCTGRCDEIRRYWTQSRHPRIVG